MEIAFSEMVVIGIVALLVLGPQRLPKAARVLGLWVRRARASWYSVKAEFERELADDELKRSMQSASSELRALHADLQQPLHTGPRPDASAQTSADAPQTPVEPAASPESAADPSPAPRSDGSAP